MKKENKQEDTEYIKVKTLNKENNRILKNILVSALIIILLIGITLGVLLKFNIISLNKDSNIFVNSQIELKHTETKTSKSEGVYMTDVSEIVENAMPSIVAITSKTLIQSGYYGPGYYGQSGYTEGAGSGIIVSQNDSEILILTNNHVVEGTNELTVQFIDNKTVDATIKGTSERKDIAVISVKTSSLEKETMNQIKIATIGSSDGLKVGNGVIAIGNALGYGQSVTTGVISALNRKVSGDDYSNNMIQIDAAINGGNSGGALLNNKGEIVGINSAKYSSSGNSSQASIEGMGFAIPITDVESLINDLMNGKEDTNGITLGIEGYMTNIGYIQGYNLPSGFYISKITSGSNADKSELEIGKIITEIEGKSVESVNNISNVLYEKKSGDKVKLKVKYISGREYKEKEFVINLS